MKQCCNKTGVKTLFSGEILKNGRVITSPFGVSGKLFQLDILSRKLLFCSRKGEFGRIVDVNRYMRWWAFKTYQRWAYFLHFNILSLSAIPISLRAFYSTRCVSMMLITRIFRRPRCAWLKWVTVEISSWESFLPNSALVCSIYRTPWNFFHSEVCNSATPAYSFLVVNASVWTDKQMIRFKFLTPWTWRDNLHLALTDLNLANLISR